MPWSPDGSSPIFSGAESSAIAVNMSYSPPDEFSPTVVSYAIFWTSVKIPPNVVLSVLPAVAGVRAAGPNVYGITDTVIDYKRNNVLGQTTLWSGLPADAEQVISYAIAAAATQTATFTARAYLSDSSYTDQGYVIQVNINYTTGKDLLQAAVDARR